MKTIVLDAGHGGHDSGAVGPRGLKEKDVVLSICLRVLAYLKGQKVKLHLTRSNDTFLSLSERASISNRLNADYFLSVHCNSANSATAEGFEVFTTPGITKADPAATDLFNRYRKEFPELKQRTDFSDGDPDKEARFTVLQNTKAPAILFELEFIHTEKGYKFFTDPENKDRMARVIAEWILAL